MTDSDDDGSSDGSDDAFLREVAHASDDLGYPPLSERGIDARIGRFVLRGKLGRGGMGVVYRALDPTLGRHIALKVLASTNDDSFREATRFRDKLDARDQGLLDALTPMVTATPRDYAESVRRLHALSDGAPQDLELLFLSSRAEIQWGSAERGHDGLARVLALDPAMALAEWGQGFGIRTPEAVDSAIAHFEKCASISPMSSTCIRQAGRLRGRMGQCDAFLDASRKAIAAEPSDLWAHTMLLSALLARGRDRAELMPIIDRAMATPIIMAQSPRRAVGVRRDLTAAVGFWFGDLDDVERTTRSEEHLADDDDVLLEVRLELFEETAQVGAMIAAARAYVAARASADEGFADGPVLRILRENAIYPEERIVALRDAWFRQASQNPSQLLDSWPEYFAEPALTPAQATAALALLTSDGGAQRGAPYPSENARMGRLYLLAGRPAVAAPLLERAANACDVVDTNVGRSFVTTVIRARYDLGLAREALHDAPAACAAYARVLERWGHAKPRSVTAEKSRARMSALGCVAVGAPK